ncbi:hypothetical protein IB285_02560 [Erythrobacter sp. KMU-140]|uniref:Uncharacterized protein n=2 Tax=Erythrobacter rubeus TaxID=2760803 RepID=A0ABR8KL87_9SPHN|nr:hypothetical protein [Erythrobacter rubeus]
MVLIGIVAPVTATLLIAQGQSSLPLNSAIGPILAIGMMGTGMIAAAAAGRFATGVWLGLAVGIGLLLLAEALGQPLLPYMPALGLAVLAATISFAARGALFAKSMGGKGWLMALFVVAGEAAIVLTALAMPGALPEWLLALLPAQWASLAIQTGFAEAGMFGAWAALLALGGTAAATLFVARLWPSRWPYLVMFTTWLGLSALVYYHS